MKNKLKFLLAVMVVIIAFMGISASAATATSGSCGDTAKYTLENGVLTISGTGAMEDYSAGSAPWYSQRNTITKVIVEEGVTYIGDRAFSYCSKLEEVQLPDSLVETGRSAFSSCSSLKSVTFGESFTTMNGSTFSGSSALEYVSFPKGFTSYGSSELSSNSATIIKGYTYSAAEMLAIKLKLEFESTGFLEGETLAEGAVNDSVFWQVDSLSRLIITGTGAMESYSSTSDAPWYSYRNSYKRIEVGEGITHIGKNTFNQGHYSVVKVDLPSTLVSIGEEGLAYVSLNSLYIPPSVTSIHKDAFYGAYSFPIHGYRYSCAYEYAIDKGWTFVSLGDMPLAYYGEGTIGEDISWSLDNRGKLVLEGEGEMPDFAAYAEAPWYSHRTIVREVEISGAFANIGAYYFGNLPKLAKVVIPDGVERIGDHAFDTCTSLKTVAIPESVTAIGDYAFNSSAVTAIILPQNVKTIGNYAFNKCRSLSALTCNGAVEVVGDYAFCNTYITDFSFAAGLREIGDYAFAQTSITSFFAPATLESVGDYAFAQTSYLQNCVFNKTQTVGAYALADTKATNIVLPDNMTKIPEGMFYNVKSIGVMPLHKNIEEIGDYAFYGCSKLYELKFPDSVKAIGKEAFSGCSGVKNITIPEKVTELSEGVFRGTGITAIEIPDNIKAIGTRAFYNCTDLGSVTMGSGTTSIGDYAFYGCSLLSEPGIGSSVEKIGNYAFNACTTLASVTIPDCVTELGVGVFKGCSKLESVVLSKNITKIPDYCFESCSVLSTIEPHEGITAIGDKAFYKALKCALTMPSTLKAIGESAFEGSYATGIELNDGLEELGTRAFAATKSIPSFTFPGSLKVIPKECFANSALTSFVIEEGVEEIGQSAFEYALVDKVTIPSSVKVIRTKAFYRCSKLTDVVIEDGVSEIADYAFAYCASLATVTISDSVGYIATTAFYDFPDTAVMKGYTGSIAHWLATRYKYNFEALGEAEAIVVMEGTMNDDISWTLSNHGVLTFSGRGDVPAMYNYSDGKYPWKYCPGFITKIVAEHGITYLGSHPYEGLDNITEVEASYTLLGMTTTYKNLKGDVIFTGYEGNILETVAEEKGYTFVSKGEAQDEVAIEGNYNGIEWSITTLGEITLYYDGVIPEEDFYDLGSYPWEQYCDSINAVVIEEGVTEVNSYVFERDFHITTLTLPCSLTYVSFPYGTILEGATVYAHTYSEGYDVYGNSSKYNFVSLGIEPLKVRAEGTFGDNLTWKYYNHRILEITGDGAMSNMGNYAPWNNCLVKTVVMSGNITSIGKNAFNGESITEFTIPETVESIENNAFSGSKIKEIVIPETVTELGKYVFFGCKKLESVWILCENANLSDSFFENCYSLKQVQLPKNTTIGEDAFKNTGVEYIYYEGTKSDFAKYVTGAENLPEDAVIFFSSSMPEEVYVKDVRVTKSTNGANVKLTAKLRGGEAVFIAGYDGDGTMVTLVRLIPYENSHSLKGDIETVKVFFWEGESSLIPVNEVYTENIN